MYFLQIREWSKYQHYKDRNPPWIKLHRELLTSLTWTLSDNASRVLAVASMMLAAIHDNRIPADPEYFRRVAYLHEIPDFSRLIELEFLECVDSKGIIVDASIVLASCKQPVSNARPETETETEKRKKELKPSAQQKPLRGTNRKMFDASVETRHTRIQGMVMTAYQERNGVECPWNGAEGRQLKSLLTKTPNWVDSQIAQCLEHYYESEGTTPSDCPHTYLDKLPKYLAGPLDKFGKLIGSNGNGNGKSGKTAREIEIERRNKALDDFLDGKSSSGVSPNEG